MASFSFWMFVVREQYDCSRLVDGVLNVKFLDKVDVLNINEKVVVAVWRMINRISWVAENFCISKRTSVYEHFQRYASAAFQSCGPKAVLTPVHR